MISFLGMDWLEGSGREGDAGLEGGMEGRATAATVLLHPVAP
jgi:hypothetical protein